ncbi:hypothetical protein [Mordavella massiliensis]|uniref:hypothetical protein n=1 Tax=Mordavella massiliensis TaxID=1871024 RepID=UPI0037094AA6
MAVGNGAAPQLLPSLDQREKMYCKIREYRGTKPIFSMDFQKTLRMSTEVTLEICRKKR